ncbi:MAG: radical SAM protein [Nanoarchaeota archaeon]|nr:radical SAM protein [Nanoarchaeota archaeon]
MEQDQLYYPITIMLKLTDFCPNNCLDGKYCFSGCNPNARTWIDRGKILDIFQQAKEIGMTEVAYISTEPFTNVDFLVDVIKKARQAEIASRFLVTNGKIGITYNNARDCFKKIQDSGFDFTIDETYLGTGYNGIDVSVDQFHKIPAEHTSNTILAALEVFGPTNFVSIRTTDPSDKYKDPKTLNEVVRYLQESGKVQGINYKTKEIVFVDRSRVIVNHISAAKFGNAKTLPDDFFKWHEFSLEELVETKDLRECSFLPLSLKPLPYHKLYIDPNGQTNPDLSRAEVLRGGSVYDTPVSKAIENINSNPLVALMISYGFAGVLTILKKKFGVSLDLKATSGLDLRDRYLSQIDLMEQVKTFIRESGLEKQLRAESCPVLARSRDLIGKRRLEIIFD